MTLSIDQKKNIIQKTIIVLLTLFFVSLVFLAYFSLNPFSRSDDLRVIFLDIGQGDAALIQTPDQKNILIDGGPSREVLFKLDQYIPFYNRQIDLMILTHPDPDHLTGLVEILKRWSVKQIAYTGVKDDRSSYLIWEKLIAEKEISLSIIDRRATVALGEGITLDFLWPLTNIEEKNFSDDNDYSIVNRLGYGRISFLFTGDASKKVEQQLIELGMDLPADVLKVGHHGSKYSSGSEFLQAVSPAYGVISVGEDNNFGHPSYRVIRNLEQENIKILRTDQKRDIMFITQGQNIKLITN